jgi:ankyrin repeat protein
MKAGTVGLRSVLCLLFLSSLAYGGEIVEAAKNGDLESVRSILAEDPSAVRATDEARYTPLHWASMRAHWDVAALLLEHGPDVNVVGEDGGSPLNWAAHHDNPEFIGKLLDKGADADARNRWGMTSLHTAAWRGCVEAVRLMLDRGANPEIRTKEGWTVLHMAYRSGHDPVIALLIKRGARTDVKDDQGRTPQELRFHRPPAAKMNASELDEYVGTYRYKNTAFTLEIWREGDQLHLIEYGPDRLYPAKKDLFYCVQAPWTLTFSRDETGKVSKVNLQFIRTGYELNKEPG